MEADFQERGMEAPKQHREPGSAQGVLEERDSVRRKLWRSILEVEQIYMGKVIPTVEQRYLAQYEVRELLLGEASHEEWTVELDRLVQEEMQLDESYRALRWFVAQVCPGTADGSPTEGFSYDGLGLLYEKLYSDPDFGSDSEWRLEDIVEYRDQGLIPLELSWVREDVEFLAAKEWELEIAYKQLRDSAQQFGKAPFDWGESEEPSASPEVLEESETECDNAGYCTPLTVSEEADLRWQMQNILPHLDEPGPAQVDREWREASPQHLIGRQGEEVVGHPPQQQDAIPVATSPAEALATVQNNFGLCIQETPVCLVAVGETEVPTGNLLGCGAVGPEGQQCAPGRGWLRELEGLDMFGPEIDFMFVGETEALPPARGRCAAAGSDPQLGVAAVTEVVDLVVVMEEPVEIFTAPAEELASGQRVADLYPPPAAPEVGEKEESHPLTEEPRDLTAIPSLLQPQSEIPVGETGGLIPQRQAKGQGGALNTPPVPFVSPDLNTGHLSPYCPTNTGPDQLGIWYLVCLLLGGEICDKPNSHCAAWRRLWASLQPRDYGPRGDLGFAKYIAQGIQGYC